MDVKEVSKLRKGILSESLTYELNKKVSISSFYNFIAEELNLSYNDLDSIAKSAKMMDFKDMEAAYPVPSKMLFENKEAVFSAFKDINPNISRNDIIKVFNNA